MTTQKRPEYVYNKKKKTQLSVNSSHSIHSKYFTALILRNEQTIDMITRSCQSTDVGIY